MKTRHLADELEFRAFNHKHNHMEQGKQWAVSGVKYGAKVGGWCINNDNDGDMD